MRRWTKYLLSSSLLENKFILLVTKYIEGQDYYTFNFSLEIAGMN